MNDPVVEFCEILASFPPDEVKTLIELSCLAIGAPDKPTGVAFEQARYLSDFSRPFTVEDLHRRLMFLHNQMDVWADVLIPGLLHYLTSYFEQLADPNEVSGKIDQYLEIRQNLEAELAKPIDQRKDNLPDEKLKRLMKTFADIMGSVPSQKETGRKIAERLREEWERRFTTEYWKAWTREYLRRTKPPGF